MFLDVLNAVISEIDGAWCFCEGLIFDNLLNFLTSNWPPCFKKIFYWVSLVICISLETNLFYLGFHVYCVLSCKVFSNNYFGFLLTHYNYKFYVFMLSLHIH